MKIDLVDVVKKLSLRQTDCIYPQVGRAGYVSGTYRIFEEIIFAKVGLTLLISLSFSRSAKLTILDAGKKIALGEFYSLRHSDWWK